MVSAVSPDCEIPITSPWIGGGKYLNSDAKSSRTGIAQESSRRYLKISPALYEEPHAMTVTDSGFLMGAGSVSPVTDLTEL